MSNTFKDFSSKKQFQSLEPRIVLDGAGAETFEDVAQQEQAAQQNQKTNDEIGGSILLNDQLGQAIAGSNQNSPIQDSPRSDGADNGVWYHFDAEKDGILNFDVTRNSFPTRIFLFETIVENPNPQTDLTEININNRFRSFDIQVEEGKSYYFLIDGSGNRTGTFEVNSEFEQQPENDTVETAQILDLSTNTQIVGTTKGAIETNPGLNAFDRSDNTVWYKISPNDVGRFEFDFTNDTQRRHALFVYETNKGDLPTNDDRLNINRGSRSFDLNLDSDKDYWIGIDGSRDNRIDFAFDYKFTAAPENDLVQNAEIIDITNLNGQVQGTTIAAIQKDALNGSARNDQTVWYRLTAEEFGILSLSFGSEDQVRHFTRIHETDGSLPVATDFIGSTTANLSAGKTYFIAVDSQGTREGTFNLQYEFTQAPDNDIVQNAEIIDISDLNGQVQGTTIAAVQKDALNGSVNNDQTVWYKINAEQFGVLRLSFDPLDQIRHFTRIHETDGSLPVASDFIGSSTANLIAGKTYFIAVDSQSTRQGLFNLQYEFTEAPRNDVIADAIDLGNVSNIQFEGTNIAAVQTDSPIGSERNDQAVWYKYNPLDDTNAVVTIEGDRRFTLTVFEQPVTTDPTINTDNLQRTSAFFSRGSYNFTMREGLEYFFLVDATSSNTGDFTFTLTADSRDNDSFEDAQFIGSGTQYVLDGSNRGAFNADRFGGNSVNNSVWYEYKAPADGILSFTNQIPTSDFPINLNIFKANERTDNQEDVRSIKRTTSGNTNITVEKDAVYYFAIDGRGRNTGDYQVFVEHIPNADQTLPSIISLGEVEDVTIVNSEFNETVSYEFTAKEDAVLSITNQNFEDYIELFVVLEDGSTELIGDNNVTLERQITEGQKYLISFTKSTGNTDNELRAEIFTNPLGGNLDIRSATQLGDLHDFSTELDLTASRVSPNFVETSESNIIWLEWTAHEESIVALDASTENFQPEIVVFEKNNDELTEIHYSVLASSKVNFISEEGQTYLFQIHKPSENFTDVDEVHDSTTTFQLSSSTDAPIPVNGNEITLEAAFEGDSNPRAYSVDELFSPRYFQQNDDAFAGVAIGLDIHVEAHGTYEYSFDNGQTWNLLDGTSSIENAVILETDDLIRFSPSENHSGQVDNTLFAFLMRSENALAAGDNQNIISLIGDTFSTTAIEVKADDTNAVADAPELTLTELFEFQEDESILLKLDVNQPDQDGSETLQLTVSGLPEGFSLSNSTIGENGVRHIDLELFDAANNILIIVPTENFNGDFSFTINATSTEQSNQDSATTDLDVTLNVAAVIDQSDVDITPAVGDESNEIPVNITIDNNDNNQAVQILIDNIPDNIQLSNGTKLDSGAWALEKEDLTDLRLIPNEFLSGEFTFEVTILDFEPGIETPLTSQFDLPVTINAVANPAEVTVTPAQGLAAEPIELPINVGLVDIDGSEFIKTIRILNLPDEVTLSAGNKQADGSWIVPENSLDNLSILTPRSFEGLINAELEIITEERSNNDQDISLTELPIIVEANPIDIFFTADNFSNNQNNSSTGQSNSFSPFSFGNLAANRFDLSGLGINPFVNVNTVEIFRYLYEERAEISQPDNESDFVIMNTEEDEKDEKKKAPEKTDEQNANEGEPSENNDENQKKDKPDQGASLQFDESSTLNKFMKEKNQFERQRSALVNCFQGYHRC